LTILLAAIAGSRILYLLSNPTPWQDAWRIWEGGLSFMGGLIGAFTVSLLILRLKKIPFATVSDATGFAMPLGHAIGRIGCFMAACCWGIPWDGPLGVAFTHPACGLPTELMGVRLFPAQLAESAGLLAIFLLLRVFRNPLKGRVFGTYLASYGALRFLLETMRGDTEPGLLGLTLTQTVILAVVLPAAVVSWCIPNKDDRTKKTS
ncbi:MAG: prolipoprotein diacylglyceryl transferase family protein, partial [Elusimicrobiota bacterium]